MLRRFLFTFSIVASIIIIFSVIVTQKRGERRAFEVKQMELAERVDSLSKTNEKLRKENKALVDDTIQIEREARDNHGYTREGEVTYKKYKFNISEPESNKAEKPTGSGGLESFLFDGPFPWQVPLGLVLIATLFLLLSYKYER